MRIKFISILFTVLLTALLLLTACGEEKLRYNVNNVSLEAIGFEEYSLTDPEINELFDALSLLDFSDEKTESKEPLPVGAPNIICTVETDSENIIIVLTGVEGQCITVERGGVSKSYYFSDDPVYQDKVRSVIHEIIADKAGIDFSRDPGGIEE